MTRSKKTNQKTPYRPHRKSAAKSRSPLFWLCTGIMMGLIFPSFLYLKSHGGHHSTPEKTEISLIENKTLEGRLPKPHPKVAKHTNEAPSDSKYDFYNMLPSQENEAESRPIEKQNTADVKAETKYRQYLLEIASFHDYAKADHMKAQLALIGVDKLTITKVTSQDQISYKLVAGPFDSSSRAEQLQKQLSESDIKSTLKAVEREN